MEERLNKKLKKLIEGTRNKNKEKGKEKEIKFAEKLLNLTETKFTENEHKLLGKSLKYATKTNIDKENTIIECEEIIDKIKNEETKKQLRSEVKEIVRMAANSNNTKK